MPTCKTPGRNACARARTHQGMHARVQDPRQECMRTWGPLVSYKANEVSLVRCTRRKGTYEDNA